jgi:predicted nucleic acid-binding protein
MVSEAQHYLLDTSYWITLWKKKEMSESAKKANCLLAKPLAVPCINGTILAELLRGLTENKKDGERRRYICELKCLDLTKKTFIKAAELAQVLDRNGKTIALPDCLIAANAIENKAVLIASDKHFLRFKELEVVIV